eukprot:jgi/Mesvir1/18488/Mv14333-RA.1
MDASKQGASAFRPILPAPPGGVIKPTPSLIAVGAVARSKRLPALPSAMPVWHIRADGTRVLAYAPCPPRKRAKKARKAPTAAEIAAMQQQAGAEIRKADPGFRPAPSGTASLVPKPMCPPPPPPPPPPPSPSPKVVEYPPKPLPPTNKYKLLPRHSCRDPSERLFPAPGGIWSRYSKLSLVPYAADAAIPEVEKIDPAEDAAGVYPLVVVTPATQWGQVTSARPLCMMRESDENGMMWKFIKAAGIEDGWRAPCELKGTSKASRGDRETMEELLSRVVPDRPEVAAQLDQRAALRMQSLALSALHERLLRKFMPSVDAEKRERHLAVAQAFSRFAMETVIPACASAGRAGKAAIANRVAGLKDKLNVVL